MEKVKFERNLEEEKEVFESFCEAYRNSRMVGVNMSNNIWNKYDFKMAGIGCKFKLHAKVKHIRLCIKWSKQRIVRGYADCDVWEMYPFLQTLIPDMLQALRDTRQGSPGYLGENYTNDDGILVNDTCHSEWNKILDQMIFLWRESNEETCVQKNPYEDEYLEAFKKFEEQYGFLGEKLQTAEELAENEKRGGGGTMHFMREIPEYKEISEKYRNEQNRLEEYRKTCKDQAFDLMKQHFFALWY